MLFLDRLTDETVRVPAPDQPVATVGVPDDATGI